MIYNISYKSLAAAEGREAAFQYLNEAIPKSWRNSAARGFFEQDEYDLLWSMIPNPTDNPKANDVWLYRAAAASIDPAIDRKHGQALRANLNSESSSYKFRIARALLGLESRRAVLQSAKNEGQFAEAARLSGSAAEARGDLEEAIRFYQVAVSSRAPRSAAYRSAAWRLVELSNDGKALDLRSEEIRAEIAARETVPASIDRSPTPSGQIDQR